MVESSTRIATTRPGGWSFVATSEATSRVHVAALDEGGSGAGTSTGLKATTDRGLPVRRVEHGDIEQQQVRTRPKRLR